MKIILKDKIRSGLEKYMNLINEKIKSYNNRLVDENGLNDIMSFIEICIEICDKNSNFLTHSQKSERGK